MPAKSWRIGVETTTRFDLIARSGPTFRSTCTIPMAQPARHRDQSRGIPAPGGPRLGLRAGRGSLSLRMRDDRGGRSHSFCHRSQGYKSEVGKPGALLQSPKQFDQRSLGSLEALCPGQLNRDVQCVSFELNVKITTPPVFLLRCVKHSASPFSTVESTEGLVIFRLMRFDSATL